MTSGVFRSKERSLRAELERKQKLELYLANSARSLAMDQSTWKRVGMRNGKAALLNHWITVKRA